MKRLSLLSLSLLTAACAASVVTPDPGDPGSTGQPGDTPAFLTIVGERDVFMGSGAATTITVKYADAAGHPIPGTVSFHIEGAAASSHLSAASGVTSSEGLASVDVVGASDAAVAFQVVAEAANATAVDWRVAVSGPTPGVQPLSFTGTYQVDSQLDIVSGLPGTLGDVVNGIIDMTDGPNDPATWLIDLALTKIDNSTVTSAVNSVRPALDTFANGMLKQYAPDIVTQFISLGDAFGQVTRRLGLKTVLTIVESTDDAGAARLTATHTLTGVYFTVDSVNYEYSAAELDLTGVSAQGVAVTASDTKVSIADHRLPLSYGQLIVFALNNVVIPYIDPWASNLTDLLKDAVDCYSISYDIADYVGVGDPSLYESACLTGLDFAGAFLEGKLSEIAGTAASLDLLGDARPFDSNGDRVIDRLQAGLWQGRLDFGLSASTLTDQKFLAERMAAQ